MENFLFLKYSHCVTFLGKTGWHSQIDRNTLQVLSLGSLSVFHFLCDASYTIWTASASDGNTLFHQMVLPDYSDTIGHFRVPLGLWLKASPSAKPFLCNVMSSVFRVFASFPCFQGDATFSGCWFHQLVPKKVFFSIPLVRLPRIHNQNFTKLYVVDEITWHRQALNLVPQ